MHVLDFLRKFRENNLLANVNLDIGYGERDQMLPVLDKILPLISSIYSINFDIFDNVYDNFKESQPLLKTIVAQAKILAIRWLDLCSLRLLDFFIFRDPDASNCTWENKIDWFCSWLYNPRDDGMPRTLNLETLNKTNFSFLIDRIKKVFIQLKNELNILI
jgi:hypothetical protein